MKRTTTKSENGFSMIELMIAMVVMLLALGIVSMLLARAMSVKERESRTADALTTAQGALSVLSREIANSGFGMYDNSLSRTADNGIVIADSSATQIRIRANHDNAGGLPSAPGPTTLELNEPGEDVTYFFDDATRSIVRYDANALGEGVPQTSVVVNRISSVEFEYYDYTGASSTPAGPFTAPSVNTARVRIIVTVELDPVVGQPDNQVVTFASEVTLRNNGYMLRQY
ncbi:MAG TPA: type II secretion system protein [Pyrinomonadaceae bacterium]|nr:type II secretion system protein [Pyrinomonadaceae bacterium]